MTDELIKGINECTMNQEAFNGLFEEIKKLPNYMSELKDGMKEFKGDLRKFVSEAQDFCDTQYGVLTASFNAHPNEDFLIWMIRVDQ